MAIFIVQSKLQMRSLLNQFKSQKKNYLSCIEEVFKILLRILKHLQCKPIYTLLTSFFMIIFILYLNLSNNCRHTNTQNNELRTSRHAHTCFFCFLTNFHKCKLETKDLQHLLFSVDFFRIHYTNTQKIFLFQ